MNMTDVRVLVHSSHGFSLRDLYDGLERMTIPHGQPS